MKNVLVVLVLMFSGCTSFPFSGSSSSFQHTEFLLEAEEALDGLISNSGEGIPPILLRHTKAIVVFPNLVKAAVIAGTRVGKGVVIARSLKTGKWNPPAFIKFRQASWGIQAGIQEAELVLLVVTKKGLKQLFKRQFSLTEGPQLAIGPVGKTLDLNLDKLLSRNDILAYSRIKGLFAGVSFEDTIISSDKYTNYEYYQQVVSNRSLLIGKKGIKVPVSGQVFLKSVKRLEKQAGNKR